MVINNEILLTFKSRCSETIFKTALAEIKIVNVSGFTLKKVHIMNISDDPVFRRSRQKKKNRTDHDVLLISIFFYVFKPFIMISYIIINPKF